MRKGNDLKAIGLSCCSACGDDPEYSILMCVDRRLGGQGVFTLLDRFYLPNQATRALQGTTMDKVEQVAFCHACMRQIEKAVNRVIHDNQNRFAVDSEGPLVV